jgi:hypothetical protein
MRRRNWRLVIAGLVLAVLAAGFFLYMMGMAAKSTDPVEMMKTVGQVSGGVGALGLVLAVFGLIGRKAPAEG